MGLTQLTIRRASSWGLAATSTALLLLAGCQSPLGTDDSTPQDPSMRRVSASVTSGGSTFYVSPSGSDNNSGTSTSSPWKTLSKVSGRTYSAGAQILFQGGATFSGRLYLDSRSTGTASTPITIGSYGTGRAILNGGSGDAIFIYNAGGIAIKNLVVQSSGRSGNTGSGVDLFTDVGGGAKVASIKIDNVDITGFGKAGITIGSWNGSAGFKDVTITNVNAYGNTLAGIQTYAQSPYSHQNVYIGHTKVYGNPGKAGLSSPSGSGILLAGVSGGTVERCLAHDNGNLSDAPGGPVGIWAYDSEKLVFQYNESYFNHTSKADGGGFDFDQNTRYSTMQYNYSHNNDGPGLLLAHSPNNSNHTNNVIRYNISENDSRKGQTGAITVYGKTLNAEIYNNTIYVTPSSGAVPRGIFIHNYTITYNVAHSVHVRNNNFFTNGGVRLVEVYSGELTGTPDLRFQGNSYYPGTGTFSVMWGSTNYASLVAWRATTQELLSGVAVGLQGNPGLTAPGQGGTIGNADLLASLSAYKLTSTSTLVNKGLNLAANFGIAVPGFDYYADVTPYGLGFDVGAHEWH